jgi:hypothetical protein
LANLARNPSTVPGTTVAFGRLFEPTEALRKAFELVEVPIPLRLA